MKRFDAPAKAYFEEGKAALARADLPSAQENFRKCSELAPANIEAWYWLGMSLTFNAPQQAAEALDQALKLDPEHEGALFWRAEVDWLQGNASSAARILQRLNQLAPFASHTLGRLGLAHLAAGERDAAMNAFEEAVRYGKRHATSGARHTELRCAIYLDLLGRRDEARQLIDAVNSAGPAGYSSRRYPRDLEDQRCALEELVAGRDIVILGSGPSLGQLEPALEALGPAAAESLCFFGFNNVPVAERVLLDSIGRRVELAAMTAAHVMELHREWIAQFLARGSSVFMTTADALPRGRPTADRIMLHPDKVFYFAASGDYPPIPEDPLHFPPINTLLCVVALAALARPRRIFLFGCDGAAPAAAPVYFRQGSAEYGNQSVAAPQYARWLARDTFLFNATVPTVLACVARLHGVPVPEIVNCNPDSAYDCFPRISACDFVARCQVAPHPSLPERRASAPLLARRAARRLRVPAVDVGRLRRVTGRYTRKLGRLLKRR